MNQKDYEAVSNTLLSEAEAIEISKRPGYTQGDHDVLKNFKRAGERNGITTEQAWGVFFDKHYDAIKSIMLRPDLPVSEAPLGRFADAVNYLKLGWAILHEREAMTKSSVTPSSSPVRDVGDRGI
jgi:hypothetical protein